MGKKVKLNLDELKVQSFVTELKKRAASKEKGGGTGHTCQQTCDLCGSVPGIPCRTFPTCAMETLGDCCIQQTDEWWCTIYFC